MTDAHLRFCHEEQSYLHLFASSSLWNFTGDAQVLVGPAFWRLLFGFLIIAIVIAPMIFVFPSLLSSSSSASLPRAKHASLSLRSSSSAALPSSQSASSSSSLSSHLLESSPIIDVSSSSSSLLVPPLTSGNSILSNSVSPQSFLPASPRPAFSASVPDPTPPSVPAVPASRSPSPPPHHRPTAPSLSWSGTVVKCLGSLLCTLWLHYLCAKVNSALAFSYCQT